MMVKLLADTISIVFEPFTVSLVSLILITTQLKLGLESKLVWFLTAAVLGGVPPTAVLIYEKKIGKIKDWFITNRLERRDVHLAWFFGSVLFVVVAVLFQAPRLLMALSLTLMFLSLAIGLINSFWKISVHMVGVTLLIVVLLLVYSAGFLWAVVLLPLVAWARISLGHHTLSQITVATILTIIITFGVFSLFGLATF